MSQKIQVIEASEEPAQLRPIQECLTPKLKQSLHDLPDEIRELSLEDLEKRLSITPTLRQVKIGFWNEYRRTIVEHRNTIVVGSVIDGVCSYEYFYREIANREEMLAWLFHAPTDFDRAAEEALSFGIERLRNDILTAPLYATNQDGSRGAFNKDNASVVLNAIKFLDARVKGSPLQRIEQKSLHLHKNADGVHKGITRDELNQELESLRQRLSGGAILLSAPVPDETE